MLEVGSAEADRKSLQQRRSYSGLPKKKTKNEEEGEILGEWRSGRTSEDQGGS